MRIAIAGIIHETNTYCRDQTTTVDFHQSRGERIFKSRGTETSIGGALAICAELGIEVVPLLVVSAQPSGLSWRPTTPSRLKYCRGWRRNYPLSGSFWIFMALVWSMVSMILKAIWSRRSAIWRVQALGLWRPLTSMATSPPPWLKPWTAPLRVISTRTLICIGAPVRPSSSSGEWPPKI